MGINVCLYAPNLEPAEIEKFSPDQLFQASSPVKLAQAAAQCSAALTNSSLNTVSTFLRRGTPQLVLPSNAERFMVGRRLELARGGLAALPNDSGSTVTAKLRAILQQRSFKRAAEQFAARYADDGVEQQTLIMLADIDRLLAH